MGSEYSSTAAAQAKKFILVIAGIAAMAGLLFGYDTGVISGAILFIRSQFSLTSAAVETVVSAVLFGAVIGAACSGSIADGLGRRRTIIITAVLFSVGAIGAAVAGSVHLIVVFRFMIGLAIGVASYTAPLYISEVSPSNVRGALVSLNQLMITIGIFVSYIVDYVLTGGNNEWRWMFGLGAIPGIILIIGMIFLPESPRWLISRSLHDRAREILRKTHGIQDVEEHIKEIQGTLTQKGGSWRELLQPWLRPAFIVGILLAFFQQATGINTIIYYAPTIFGFAGFESAKASILATAGIGLVNVGMTVVAIWLLDKLGRRPLLFIGLAGMIISLGLIGLAFMIGAAGILKWLTVGCLVLYIASFAISLGPIFWLMIAEIYPLSVRGRAMSIATVANWGFNMLVAATFLTLTEILGKAGTFWFYGAIAVIGWIFCFVYVPETKGISLEKIEAHLKSGKKLRQLGC